MAQRLAKAGEVSYQPLYEITNERKQWFYSIRQKKRKSQGGNRDGQDRREDRPAASIKRSTSCAYNQDGRPVMITKHISASMGYDQNDRHQHIASCASVMDSQPASITKTGEAGHGPLARSRDRSTKGRPPGLIILRRNQWNNSRHYRHHDGYHCRQRADHYYSWPRTGCNHHYGAGGDSHRAGYQYRR